MPAYIPPKPLDFDAIRKTVVGVIITATGLPQSQIVMSESERMGAPRPKAPYVTFAMAMPSAREGVDWPEAVMGDAALTGLHTYFGLREMTVEFESFGTSKEEAYHILAALQAGLDYEPVATLLGAANLAVRGIGDIVDLTTTMSTAFEGRAQLTAELGALSRMVVDLGQIVSVPVSGEVALECQDSLIVGPVTINEQS